MNVWKPLLLALLAPLLLAGCKPSADADNPAETDEVAGPPTDEDVVSLLDVRHVYIEGKGWDEHVTDTRSPDDAVLVEQLISQEAVPLLIAHLGDARPTWTVCIEETDDSVQVPLGYLCLDILLAMSSADSPVFKDTAVIEGFWPNVRPEFFFGPTILWEEKTAPARMREVQRAWEAALAAGQLRFDPEGTQYVRRMPYRE